MTTQVTTGPEAASPASRSTHTLEWWHRVDDLVSSAYRPILRVVAVLAGVVAFGCASAAILTDLAGPLLVASGGFGALSFGVAGVLTQLASRDAALRKGRAIARLVRRSLVEMVNRSDGVIMAAWIGDIGASASLDPVQQLLRELLDEMAHIGGWRADSAERALHAFLKAGNHINPLFERLPKVGDFAAEDLARKGKILGALVASVEATQSVSPPEAEEPSVKPKIRTLAEKLDEWYGGVQL